METGHVLIGNAGELVGMDAAFCAIMRSTIEEMRGRLIVDITAPADREECARAIAALRQTGRAFEITKRYLRDDGSLIWVKNHVSITLDGDLSGMIVATVEPVSQSPRHAPAVLLDAARLHLDLRRNRATVCDPKFLREPGWDAILAIYTAEAEGRSLDVPGLAAILDVSVDLTARWIKALLIDAIIEVEYGDLHAETAKSYRLTAPAMARLEQFLARYPWRRPHPTHGLIAD